MGFLECYAKTSSSLRGARFNDIKDSCSSDEILFGVRSSSTKNFFILATGKKDVVFNYTPKQSGIFYLDNWSGGVNWYLNEASFGFTSAGSVRQGSADTNLQNVNTAGLSIHTDGTEDSLVASSPWAYSKYNTTSTIGINNPSYEIAFFTKSSDVPISLALGGLGLLGLSYELPTLITS